MRFATLGDWLRWQEKLHPWAIDLGLERVATVARRLGVARPSAPIITVGGTNGKGSTVAYLEAVLQALGYRPGRYTSPHLLRYNERIRIAGREATDKAIIAAFEAVEQARSDTSLTYFEFGTLAACYLFRAAKCDIWLLEVGLGGRLDAVNILDADVAVLTNVQLDHTEWLGPDRDSIGREKAGIMRLGRPVILGSADMPRSVTAYAAQLGSDLRRLGRDFDFGPEAAAGRRWWWRGRSAALRRLPLPGLAGQHQMNNAAAALAGLEALGESATRLDRAARRVLPWVRLPGRQQWIAGSPNWLLDVAHNAAAAAQLAALLRVMPVQGQVRCLFGLLRRKDLEAVVKPLLPLVDQWYLLELPGGDGWAPASVAAHLQTHDARIVAAGAAGEVVARVRGESDADDRVVAFGSFRGVAEVMRALAATRRSAVDIQALRGASGIAPRLP